MSFPVLLQDLMARLWQKRGSRPQGTSRTAANKSLLNETSSKFTKAQLQPAGEPRIALQCRGGHQDTFTCDI